MCWMIQVKMWVGGVVVARVVGWVLWIAGCLVHAATQVPKPLSRKCCETRSLPELARRIAPKHSYLRSVPSSGGHILVLESQHPNDRATRGSWDSGSQVLYIGRSSMIAFYSASVSPSDDLLPALASMACRSESYQSSSTIRPMLPNAALGQTSFGPTSAVCMGGRGPSGAHEAARRPRPPRTEGERRRFVRPGGTSISDRPQIFCGRESLVVGQCPEEQDWCRSRGRRGGAGRA